MPDIANNRRTQIQGNLRKGKTFGEKLDPGFSPKRSPLRLGKGLGSPKAAAGALGGAGRVSGGVQAGLGAQLSHKVSTGALTQLIDGDWGDTTIDVGSTPVVDVITNREFQGGALKVADLLEHYPVALLIEVGGLQ